jgi:hypothetical protein
MADQSGPTHFQSRFDSALQDYGLKTGIPLAEHPLAMDLQSSSCQSIDSITTLLQRQAQAFRDSRERDRMTKAIKTIVSNLTSLSSAASLANAAGIVCQKALMACFYISDFFFVFRHRSHLRRQYKLVLVYYWMYVPFSRPHVDIAVTDIQVNQAANGVISSCHVLADLFELIGHFVDRLRVYTEISSTPTIDKTAVDLTVELISTLARVTGKLNKRRSRECFLAGISLCSASRSQIGKEFFWC